MVPNCGIESSENLRFGRLCKVPPIKKCSVKIETLRENSFQVKGPQLFNILPPKIRKMTRCSIEDFKTELDKFLSKIPDEPNVFSDRPSQNPEHRGCVDRWIDFHLPPPPF